MLDFILIRNDIDRTLVERWISGNDSEECYNHAGKHIMNVVSDSSRLLYDPNDDRFRYNKNTKKQDIPTEFSLAIFDTKFANPTEIPSEAELEAIKLKYIKAAEKLANSTARAISKAEAQSFTLNNKTVGFIAKAQEGQAPDLSDPAYMKCNAHGAVLYKRDRLTQEPLIISYYLPNPDKLISLSRTTFFAKLPDAEANMTVNLAYEHYVAVCQKYDEDGQIVEFTKKFDTLRDAKNFFKLNKCCSSVMIVTNGESSVIEDLQRIHVTPLSYTDQVADKIVELNPELSFAAAKQIIDILGVSTIESYLKTNRSKLKELTELYLAALDDENIDISDIDDLKQLLTEKLADRRDVFYTLKYTDLD